MMDRRFLLTSLAGTIVAPLAGEAQQTPDDRWPSAIGHNQDASEHLNCADVAATDDAGGTM
jgi:hypothetical protein